MHTHTHKNSRAKLALHAPQTSWNEHKAFFFPFCRFTTLLLITGNDQDKSLEGLVVLYAA